MKKKIVAVMLSLGMILGIPVAANAESLEERVTALEERVAELEKMVGIKNEGDESSTDDVEEEIISNKLNGVDVKEELIELFAKYEIDFYEDEDINYFDESDLPKPETVVKNFPNYSDELSEDGLYFYVDFDDDEECKTYVSAYSLYLMHLGHEIKESNSNSGGFIVDNKYTIVYVDNDGRKAFAVALLPLD